MRILRKVAKKKMKKTYQEQEENISNEENEIIKYNLEDFNLDYIIKYLMKKEVIVNQIICEKCE